MDIDDNAVGADKDETSRDATNFGASHHSSNKEDADDNITEQTHHIIVPSYRCAFLHPHLFVDLLFLEKKPTTGIPFSF